MKNIPLTTSLILAGCLAMSAHSASYQNEWGVSLSYLSLDKIVAQTQGISDRGYSIGGNFSGYFNSYFKYGVGGSFVIISDDRKFSQEVENINSGRQSTQTSSVNGGMLNGELGVEYRIGEHNQHASGLMLGYHLISIERGIDNCGNCYSQDIDLDNSFYLKPYYTYHISQNYLLKIELSLLSDEQSFDKILSLSLGFK